MPKEEVWAVPCQWGTQRPFSFIALSVKLVSPMRPGHAFKHSKAHLVLLNHCPFHCPSQGWMHPEARRQIDQDATTWDKTPSPDGKLWLASWCLCLFFSSSFPPPPPFCISKEKPWRPPPQWCKKLLLVKLISSPLVSGYWLILHIHLWWTWLRLVSLRSESASRPIQPSIANPNHVPGRGWLSHPLLWSLSTLSSAGYLLVGDSARPPLSHTTEVLCGLCSQNLCLFEYV